MADEPRKVGKVTGAATAGGGLGAALSQILVEFVPRLEPVEAAVTVVLTVALSLVAGYLVPPEGKKDPAPETDDDDTMADHLEDYDEAWQE